MGRWPKDAGIAGGNRCKFCQRIIRMGKVDEHRCYRTIISVSIDRAKLKRIDERAAAVGLTRSEYLTVAALTDGPLTADEQQLLDLVRGMRR